MLRSTCQARCRPAPEPGGPRAAGSGVCRRSGRGGPGTAAARPPAFSSPSESATPCPPRPPCGESSRARNGTSAGSPTSSPVPDLTADPDPQLRAVPPGRPAGRQAGRRGARRGLPRDLPDRELRQDAQARVSPLRPGQAALRPRRVPPAPPDLRPAAPRLAPAQQGRDHPRGIGLPGRHADHDRRRRVHHQRRRARRRQPAPPLARASTSSSRSSPATRSCTPAGSSPSAEAGSSSRSPRKTPWACGSTSRASSRR